jgi:hypothetical protein
VVEDVVAPGLLVAGVRPPVGKQLSGRRDHRGDEDDEVDGHAVAHEWGREAAERVPHDDDARPVADRVDGRVGVLPPAGRLVLAREIDCDPSCPCFRSRGTTRCQSQAVPPPPWTRANVAPGSG